MATGHVVVSALLCAIIVGASAIAAPPGPTPGQAVEALQGDTWISATVEKREGRKYLVRYADSTEEWIAADHLRLAAPANNSISVEGPFNVIELHPPTGVARRANVVQLLKPVTRPSAPFTDLTPAAGAELGRLEQLILCPDTPNVVLAVGARRDDDIPLLRIDVSNPSAIETRVLTVHGHRIVAAADGGRILLTQPEGFGSLTLHLWEYHDTQYQLMANYTFVSNKENKHPDWARLLSPTRLLMRSGFGETYLIDLPTKRQISSLQCGDLSIHCSGQFIVSSRDQSGIILRNSDLAIIGQVPHCQSTFSVDPTGVYGATGDGRSIAVVKLQSNQQVAQIGGLAINGQVDLLGPTDLLVNGSTYYDLKTGIPVWNYSATETKSMLLANGQMLYVSCAGGVTTVSMAAIPDSAATGALTSAAPEKFLISPGAHVAIAGDLSAIGNAEKARTNLEHALTAAGHVPDNAATQFKLTVNTVTGPTEKFRYGMAQRFGPPVTKELDAPSTIVTAILTKDGIAIWQREIKFSAGFILNRRGDESVEQAVAEASKPNPDRLGSLDMPGYLVKGGAAGKVSTVGTSTLTRTGFITANDAPK